MHIDISKVILKSKEIVYDFKSEILKNVNNEFKYYLNQQKNESHYKILTAVSTLYPDARFIELGTNTGTSALAYLYGNPNDVIFTYDIEKVENFFIHEQLANKCIFRLEDATTAKFPVKFDFMFLDLSHDVYTEIRCFENLKKQNLLNNCVIMLDDIHLSTEMQEWWNNINVGQSAKFDITEHGHGSGSGILIFS